MCFARGLSDDLFFIISLLLTLLRSIFINIYRSSINRSSKYARKFFFVVDTSMFFSLFFFLPICNRHLYVYRNIRTSFPKYRRMQAWNVKYFGSLRKY